MHTRLKGDGDAVNSIAPHPTLPIVASSGIDDEVKIWDCTLEVPTTHLGGVPASCCPW